LDRRIERLLRQEERIEPPASFSYRIMAAVRQEAALPPPLAFPWLPMIAGLTVCMVLIVAGAAAMRWAPVQLRALGAPLHLPPLHGVPAVPAIIGRLAAQLRLPLGLTAGALAGSCLLNRFAHRLLAA
jgi:hypothetical protein